MMSSLVSMLSRPYHALRTFLHLQWNARRIAVVLDDCMRAMGQMHQSERHGHRLMREEVRHDLIKRGYWSALPNGWRWRR